ncbi:hypothetical protein [Microbispora sp. H13382]|uniref:hypothetical protein n=1 Tax=Microbispora sp. H13382 TaxID=2729112 RepID=UPI0016031374|nr:hypothetical protein [Microbispora sp. H13382]
MICRGRAGLPALHTSVVRRGRLGVRGTLPRRALGRSISLDCYWRSLEHIAELLGQAGFAEDARLLREPDEHEKLQRGCLLVRRPADV